MLEEKWKNAYCLQVFDDGEWSIYLKSRSNPHPGEPTMKVWVCQYGREVAQFTEKYRGYGRFEGHEELLPGYIRKEAKKAWKNLCKGKYTEEKLEQLRADFIAKYEEHERRVNRELERDLAHLA